MTRMPITATEQAVAHLDPATWAAANARMVTKMISEFSHELLITPVAEDGNNGVYTLTPDGGAVRYRFAARVLELEHWHIEPGTLEKTIDGAPAPLDAVSLIIELRDVLGIGPAALPVYLEEVTATLYGMAYKIAHGGPSAADFVDGDFQQIEAAMTEGHPAFVANSGRIGFDSVDYRAYTPEAASPIRLVWVAAHTSRAEFACSAERSYASHMAGELDDANRAAFAERLVERLAERGLDPDDYLFMPVHPWQWHNKLVYLFAGEIASQHLVYLGFGQDAYQAQQSIRTLFNCDNPTRCYVKMALSILNMGFTRGLSPYYMRGTPEINDWIDTLIRGDDYLQSRGFSILREVAAIGYRHPQLEAAAPKTHATNKMLAALWRESPLDQVDDGQRLMTMAALLHRDADEASVIGALIDASGLATDVWLARYLDAYMSPLLHCFFAHDLVFMPHGENIILVLEDNVPVRAIMKDIAEEVAVLNTEVDLPGEVARLSVEVPEELKVLSLFTDLFDLIFRYIGAILHTECGYPQQAFWQQVAHCVHNYQQGHPEFADKFAQYDLFAPEFKRSCLNRLQLRNNAQMIDLDDPAGNLQFAGTLANPIANI